MKRGELFAERYDVDEILGRGGMGEVWKVRDRVLGEVVALKLLTLGAGDKSPGVQRFLREVRLARKVTHKNVARVHDVGKAGRRHFLTMEYIEGTTLRTRIKHGPPLDAAEALRIGLALCEGLAAAHAAGVVHRDLKPANVLLETGGRVVITDFGIARGVSEEAGLTAGPIGTPLYMAPEQVAGDEVDARADLYALGVMLEEMGRAAGADVPSIALRCLERVPANRPPSVQAVAAALRASQGVDELAETSALPTERQTGAPHTDVRPTVHSAGTASRMPGRSLAVLPFRYVGPPDRDYLGGGVSDELVDVLSTTRGLSVLSSGAVRRYQTERDPLEVGRDLGVDAMVDGTVQVAGERIRIAMRLVDVRTGVQRWSERFEGGMGDVLAFQESVARRIAEALRVELTLLGDRGCDHPEAVELYLRARRKLRAMRYTGTDGAVPLLERCIELSPDFSAALSAHAYACLRAWFTPDADASRDWRVEAEASVARALAGAPDLAETHLSAGILAVHRSDYVGAARALAKAVHIAPTYADAQEYLGQLECEAGRSDEGARRLGLAAMLDPTLVLAKVELARHHGLRGEYGRADALLSELSAVDGPIPLPVIGVRSRLATLRGDTEELRRCIAFLGKREGRLPRIQELYVQMALGETEPPDHGGWRAQIDAVQNPRFRAFLCQVFAEAHAANGRGEDAMTCIQLAAEDVLVDLDWIDRCALLEPLRNTAAFASARRKVSSRAEAIWTT